MRRICVPPSLLPLQLAEFRDLSVTLRNLLAVDAPLNPRTFAFDDALATAESALTVARNQRERHSEALINLYCADLLWRSERWLEALEMAQAAASWFKLQSSPIARYNEAIAVYFRGLLCFCLHADARAMPLLVEAQSQLEENRRYWAVHTGREYFDACGRVSQWVAALLPLRAQTPPGSQTLIIPLLHFGDYGSERPIEAMAVPLDTLRAPARVLDFDLSASPDWIPLEVDKLPLLDNSPGITYFGMRIDEAGQWIEDSRPGDVVIVEALTPLALTTDPTHGGSQQPFRRRKDGTVALRYGERSGEGFVGTPRLLLRRGWRGQ